jgi:hypothetical protein
VAKKPDRPLARHPSGKRNLLAVVKAGWLRIYLKYLNPAAGDESGSPGLLHRKACREFAQSQGLVISQPSQFPMPEKRLIKTYRSPVFSLLQSALHETLQRREPANDPLSAHHPAMQQFVDAADAKLASTAPRIAIPTIEAVADCAKLYVELGWAEISGDIARKDALADAIKFSACDPLWAESVASYLAWQADNSPVPYVTHQSLDDFVLELPPPAAGGPLVVGMIGDWGTGTTEARWLLGRLLAKKPDVIIHLGDIYYSGTVSEVAENFSNLLTGAGVTVPVYTLSGNHEMYSGGRGYYGLLQSLHQPASYFCLRNRDWQILAMDTGYNDSNPVTIETNMTSLRDTEVPWHLDKLDHAAGRKSILVSHHQFFTAFGHGVGHDPTTNLPAAVNAHLYQTFQTRLGSVALWLWGHEHNLNIFRPYAGLARGRNLGASAIPIRQADAPYDPNPALYLAGREKLPDLDPAAPKLSLNSDDEYYHAFAVLRLDTAGGSSTAEYYQIDSANNGLEALVFSEQI